MFKNIIFLSIMFTATQSFAWGGRGHDSICRSAAYLVKEPQLKKFLANKPQMMGHLCNMPDFYWKSLKGDATKFGDPAHFIDIEIVGMKVEDIPTDYKKLSKKFTGKPNLFTNDGSTIKDFPREFGSSWWRTEQFMKNIANMKSEFKKAKAPANYKEEQNYSLPYNQLTYDLAVNMGLMGHFVGDNAQPFHTTADYDGYKAGHGGIHAFYEDEVVSHFDGDLDALVLQAARNLKDTSFLKGKTTIEKMKKLSVISNNEIPEVLKLDPIKEKSILKTDHGMELKTKAVRRSSEEAFEKMNSMIVTQMGRAALLLADLWDEAYKTAGKPALGSYKSYQYPFTVEFLMPDYLPTDTEKK